MAMKTAPVRARASQPARRRLFFEPLEDRRLLDAGSMGAVAAAAEDAPWHNPVYRLDVNNDTLTTPTDALNLINRFNSGGLGDLPLPETNPPQFYYDTSGDNRLTLVDLARVINGILSPPQVVVSSLIPYTADVTPLVTVTATGITPVADGTVVTLDVDLNDDGDFGDAGELGHTQSTTFAGSSTFPIAPALERSGEFYQVNLRARLKNADAVPGTSAVLPLGVDTKVSTALEDYVNARHEDESYNYAQFGDPEFTELPQGSYTYYVLEMISQTWRSAADVNIPQWHHWVGVYVPDNLLFSTALMLIDGGRNTSAAPANSPGDLGLVAVASGSVVIELTTVPNEPVIFTDETISRTEDEIIAYTFDKYIEHLGEPGNETWPLLLPMVNSAVRAMDTIQDFVPGVVEGAQIDDFVVLGGSKRGWTTWLTAAVDDRVRAIMPGVIDVLNIPAQMVHHYNAYGFFAEAIKEYEDLQLFERVLSTESRELYRIVDPYRYLTNGRFDDMPKLIANSSGDQFFVSDAGQFYLDDLPGELNRVRYFPNSSHGLDDSPAVLQARLEGIISFYGAVLFGVPLPEYSWTVAQDGSIHVQAQTHPTTVKLWQATNPDARDFRRHFWPDIQWTSTELTDQGGDNYIGDVPMPAPQGATGYFVELTFASPIPQLPPFVFTTEIRVKSTFSLTPWPFDPGSPEPSAVPATLAAAASAPLAIDDPVRGAVAIALAMQGDEGTLSDDIAAPILIVAAERASSATSDSESVRLMSVEAPSGDEVADAEIDEEAADALFGLVLDELLD